MPIIRAMTRNKTGAVLIALQIAFTLAVVVNSVSIINERLVKIARPTGMDVDNIITIWSRGFDESFDTLGSVREDLAALRALPGVVAATSINHIPLSGSGWGTELKASADESAPRINAARYVVDEQGVEALGVTLAMGRAFRAEEIQYHENFGEGHDQVIITAELGRKLFPDAEALGKSVYDGLGRPSTVVGVIEQMHGAWVGWDKLEHVMLLPEISSGPFVRYIVRVEPGARDGLMPQVEELLGRLNDQRVVQGLEAHSDIKARSYSRDRAMAVLLAAVIALLIAVTALGIVGLASFVVRQRTKQIGTRRALGARKRDIIRYFLVENWVMTSFGVVLGVALAFAFNFWLVTEYSASKLDPFCVPVAVVALWLLGLVSALGPARRAASVPPAVATRTI